MSTTHRHLGDLLHHSRAEGPSNSASGDAKLDMKLEVDIIPVSDVDRSKQFYEGLGWRLDADDSPLEGLRIVQFTPPGSGTSVTFGTGLTAAAPGSAEGGLIVSDIEAAHRRERGVARSAVPGRGTAARPRPRAHELRVVLLLQRPRRQHMARPGSHDAPPRRLTPLTRACTCTADLVKAEKSHNSRV